MRKTRWSGMCLMAMSLIFLAAPLIGAESEPPSFPAVDSVGMTKLQRKALKTEWKKLKTADKRQIAEKKRKLKERQKLFDEQIRYAESRSDAAFDAGREDQGRVLRAQADALRKQAKMQKRDDAESYRRSREGLKKDKAEYESRLKWLKNRPV